MPFFDCRATRPGSRITGEVQLAPLGRSRRQRFSPVDASIPREYDSLSFSTGTITVSAVTRSELDIPKLLLTLG